MTAATSGDLAKAWAKGDKVVAKVLDQAAGYLAIGIASLANLLNPDLVVLGGGVTEALGEQFVQRVAAQVKEQPLSTSTGSVRVVLEPLSGADRYPLKTAADFGFPDATQRVYLVTSRSSRIPPRKIQITSKSMVLLAPLQGSIAWPGVALMLPVESADCALG